MNPVVLLTNDVETTSIARGILSDATGRLVLEQGMPRLLDLYDKHHVKSTFFYTGTIARLFPEVVRMAQKRGHEIGCHGLTHRSEKAFDVLSLEQQIFHLTEAKKLLEDIAGEEIISFRAPALRVNKDTPIALAQTGFRIDSSISSQRFDLFLSHGTQQKLKWLFAPRNPYRTQPDDLFSKGNGPIFEVPVSAFILPYIGTTMRVFPLLFKVIRKLIIAESKRRNKPINFLIHPNELIDEVAADIDKPENRSKNLIQYILADYLRYHLKLINLGSNAVKLYEKEIQLLQQANGQFISLKQYVNEIEKNDTPPLLGKSEGGPVLVTKCQQFKKNKRDFTIQTYISLIGEFLDHAYQIIPVKEFYRDRDKHRKIIILRHDVDRQPLKALKLAKIESALGIHATYYFRIRPGCFIPEIVSEIAKLGHEIGYHYEVMALARGDIARAYAIFCDQLNALRELYPVTTIAMHRSPLTRWDENDLWASHDYKTLGIIGEPGRDLLFWNLNYLTDTGRRWDAGMSNIFDRVITSQKLSVSTTFDILKLLESDTFPEKIMINAHPNRWNENIIPWTYELVWQNMKNLVKFLIAYRRGDDNSRLTGE